MTLTQLQHWFSSFDYEHLIVGYGSLMNADSRLRYSHIEHQGVMVTVQGFHRGWITRSEQEQQTYVGAVAEAGSQLNAQLIPTAMSPALAEREKDYRFVQVAPQALQTQLSTPVHEYLQTRLADYALWICQTLTEYPANQAYPVSQTYIDTCLAGCLEYGGVDQARQFIKSTSHWPTHVRADREQPFYPRPGRVSPAQHQQIDALLREAGHG